MKIRILFFLLFGAFMASAQQADISIVTKSTAHGMFVHIVRPDLVGRRLDLYRKATTETSFRKVATLEPITSQGDLERRITAAQSIFAPGVAPQTTDADGAWKAYQKSDDTLRSFIAGVPQLAYVFQVAYLDRDVKSGVSYLYQCQEGTRAVATGGQTTYEGRYVFPSLATLQDTAVGPRILFRMPYTADIPVYVTVSAMRKRFTDAPTAFKPIALTMSKQQISGKAFTSFLETSDLALGEYNYRLGLKNIFGETDTAVYTYAVSNIPEQNVARVSAFRIRPAIGRHAFRLRWQLSDPRLVQSVALYRSETFTGPYTLAGHYSAKDTATTDDITVANELYFYYLELTDVFGNKRQSIKAHAVYDGHHTPTAPINVAASSTPAGVRLQWQTVDRYTRGFYVSRRQGLDGDFRQVSAFLPATNNTGIFTDSSRLDPAYTYYYTVHAESDTYDKGPASEPVSIRPASAPTLLKPPMDVHAVFRNGHIQLAWEALHLQDNATVGYQVYRRTTGDAAFHAVTRGLLYQNHFIDSTGLDNVSYQYAVTANDGTGQESLKSIPATIDLQSKFITTPERLGFERLAGGIRVKWTSIDVQRVRAIKIYRAQEDGTFKLVATLKGDSRFYLDAAVAKGILYSYRLVTVGQEGAESVPTTPLLVSF
jgi:fibronectin type 3 domain-containing protein